MKQQNSSCFATLRISTVLAMLSALSVGPVSAIPIDVTGGGITVVDLTVLGGPFETFVNLQGPGFELTTDPRFDMFPGSFLFSTFVPPGSTVDFSSGMSLKGSPDSNLFYRGQSYYMTGELMVTTPSAIVGPMVTLPFTLSAFIVGHNRTTGAAEVELELIGAGTAAANYSLDDRIIPGQFFWTTQLVEYVIEPPPIPEPTSWMLLGSGLLGYAARRRFARRNG